MWASQLITNADSNLSLYNLQSAHVFPCRGLVSLRIVPTDVRINFHSRGHPMQKSTYEISIYKFVVSDSPKHQFFKYLIWKVSKQKDANVKLRTNNKSTAKSQGDSFSLYFAVSNFSIDSELWIEIVNILYIIYTERGGHPTYLLEYQINQWLSYW